VLFLHLFRYNKDEQIKRGEEMANKSLIELEISNIDKTALICKALSSESRLRILNRIVQKPAIITELATTLDIPLSTMTMHIKLLEQANLIKVTPLPGSRGAQKMCGPVVDQVKIDIIHSLPKLNSSALIYQEDMPIGNYFDYQVTAPCGMASEKKNISKDDSPEEFSLPERMNAQIIWMTTGFLEYRFPTTSFSSSEIQIDRIEFLLEICSETFGYNEDWRSDVSFWLNGHEVGIIECPGDHGGRNGKLNPSWWPEYATQFGDLHHITITQAGCNIDAQPASNHTISSLRLFEENEIRLRIGVKPEARYAGGFNLFGNQFGDYAHGILMQVYGSHNKG
jgi:predicted transcriptional regulator